MLKITLNVSTVPVCKALYKSIRDAARYRQRKIGGKSGDSGDEAIDDETASVSGIDNDLAFLMPTADRFPRDTITIGGAINSVSRNSNESTKTMGKKSKASSSSQTLNTSGEEDLFKIFDGDNDQSNSSVYSYVSIL